MKLLSSILFIFLLNFGWSETPSSTVPLQDPVYAFIDKLTVKYGIPLKGLYTRPISRKQAANFLQDAILFSNSKKEAFSRVEKQELEYFRKDFSSDIQQVDATVSNQEKHIYTFNETKTSDYLAIDLGFKDSSGYASSIKSARTTATLYGGVRGRLRGILAFMSYCDVSSELNSLDTAYPPIPYNPVEGYPYNTFRDSGKTYRKSWDMFTAGIFWENRLFSAELGVDRMQWGPSERNQVTLSGDTPPWGLLKLETDIWKAHYTHTINIIKGMRYRDKYMYAHRLEFALPLSIKAGISEVLIYGDSTGDGDTLNSGSRFDRRSFDLVYAIPFVPYYFAQHYNGDRENTALAFDLAIYPIHGLKTYLELFLDDLGSPLSIFDREWYNKWAATMGAHYYFVWHNFDASIQMEYSRVEPWTYTHFLGESHRYRHYGQSLGAALGPNGDELYIGFSIQPNRKLEFELFFDNLREGKKCPGDAITDIHHETDAKEKTFLGNNPNLTKTIGFKSNIEITKLLGVRFFFAKAQSPTTNFDINATFDLNW